MTQKKDAAKIVSIQGSDEEKKEAVRASMITEKIQFLNLKGEILRKRARFMASHEKICVALSAIPLGDDSEFEKNEPVKLIISQGYKDDICKISNPVVLREVLTQVLSKIENVVFELDEELIK